MDGAQAQVGEVADRRGHHVQCAGGILLVAGRRGGGLPQQAEAGRVVIKAATTKEAGDAGEALALAHLQREGLTLVQRNYRVAPARGRAAAKST